MKHIHTNNTMFYKDTFTQRYRANKLEWFPMAEGKENGSGSQE